MVSQRLEEVLSYLSEGLDAKVFDKKTMEELKYLNPPAAPLHPSRRRMRIPEACLWMGRSWHTSNHARELKFGTQVNYHISWWSRMSIMTLSSKYLIEDVKDDLILQVPDQEPSTYKYEHKWCGVLVLDILLSTLCAKFQL